MKFTRKRIIYTSVVALIVVFSSTFAILMTLERTDYRNYLQGEYSKNMYDLINSVQNIRVDLGKANVVGSREQSIVVFEDIFRYSAIANDKLHSLPISQQVIGDTSKFISQVGDFCYTLAKVSSEGRELNEQDYNTIDRLKNESFSLEKQLKTASDEINNGKVKWGDIRKKTSSVLASNKEPLISEQFQGIQKQVTQYPALIYDGPFSDNALKINPKINSEKQISQKEAEQVVTKIIGKDKIQAVQLKASTGKQNIDTYRFQVTIKGRKNSDIICEISKHGGKVVYLLDNRTINKTNIDFNKSVDIGTKYLQNIGYKNMIPTYTLNYGDTALINYVYKQQNVIMYPDQIKLKIALDDGSIVGIESEKYLTSHEENRNIPTIKVSQDQARGRVGKRLNITNVRLAMVPTETNKEALCYEFSGNYKEDNFIVYINAETGYEQKIVQIINTPNGKLTM
ncbi:spore gernimation protein [Clostridium carboxidivorans P7]|uniref:Germination protein YpeB n=1 Tax=Clostridium carboxidivorans P7 TaxID=536227 RepID=C6PVF7_9CLOT|nr:germination protein YpeB [Clostridium carboxidivorans]AKN33286.1 spore gernimation protein [Clostridium carboxidivorans P7]EET86799.1 germination protein YpeB [Clostridium carboxidivorans P7]